MGPAGAVRLLQGRFPELSGLPDPDDPNFDSFDANHAYAEFVREVLRRQSDEPLVASVCSFIDDLALSGQSILQELFVIEVLENLAQDPGFCRKLYPRIHSEAQDALRSVERNMYGRSI
jgi:hypothetical protein